jgi:hypothetical protein
MLPFLVERKNDVRQGVLWQDSQYRVALEQAVAALVQDDELMVIVADVVCDTDRILGFGHFQEADIIVFIGSPTASAVLVYPERTLPWSWGRATAAPERPEPRQHPCG